MLILVRCQCWIKKLVYDLPEGDNTEACNHRRARKRALTSGVYITQRIEDVVDFGASPSKLLEAVCEDVEPFTGQILGGDADGIGSKVKSRTRVPSRNRS